MALHVDSVVLNYYEEKHKRNFDWLRVNGITETHDCFVFQEYDFSFPMFKRTIDKLIDTGIMQYLNENYYMKKIKFDKPVTGPKVLSVSDLAFGFNIWLGCCLVSCGVFLLEIGVKLMKKVSFYADLMRNVDS